MTILDNIQNVRLNASTQLVDASIQKATNTHYGIQHPLCESKINTTCVYMLLYALDSYDAQATFNFLTEAQVISIITKLQELT